MTKFEQGYNNFLLVRDRLKSRAELQCAYRRCYKKPFKFYRKHTPDEAIKILLDECDKCKETGVTI